MGFGSKWRNWVKKCVSSASILILINGTPSKPFRMGRGLRQGDPLSLGHPLSPFLFVLMGEVLNKMSQRAASLSMFRGISVGNEGTHITHLQFADDILIFCEAEEHHLLRIKNILLRFQAFSGLMVNYHKLGLLAVGKMKPGDRR